MFEEGEAPGTGTINKTGEPATTITEPTNIASEPVKTVEPVINEKMTLQVGRMA
jgi:hypothetical protein